VARALAQLGFGVRVFSRTPRVLPALECFAGMERLGEFATGLDLAINLLPNTPETAGILDHSFFGRMARGAAIVNLARGAHVVDADLIAALESEQLARAALDVFRDEPLPAAHPFWLHPRIEITPHISACTQVVESVAQIASKIEACEQGGHLQGLDLARGY